MLLDAVLAAPDVNWLTTTVEKATYLESLKADTSDGAPVAPSDGQPSATALQPSSLCSIGIESDGRLLLLFLAAEPLTEGFRTFIQTHAALLRVAPMWTLRIVFPRPLDCVHNAYQAVVHEELESPLHSATISELKWYFDHRRKAAGESVHPLTQKTLAVGAKVFGTARFSAMYQRWLRHGNAVFEGSLSPVTAEALSTGRSRVESYVLPFSYRHLLPLVANTPECPEAIEPGLRRANARGNSPPHVVNPGPHPLRDEPPLSALEQADSDWRRLVEAHNAQKALEIRS